MTTDIAAVLILTILILAVFSADIAERRCKHVDESDILHVTQRK